MLFTQTFTTTIGAGYLYRLILSLRSYFHRLDLGSADVSGGHLGVVGIHHKFLATICLLSSKDF